MKRHRLTKAEEETCRIIYRAIDAVDSDSAMNADLRERTARKLGRALWRTLGFTVRKGKVR